MLDGLLLAGGGGLLAGAADGAVRSGDIAILNDAVAAAPEIEAAIAGAGFVIARRRYRLDDAAAREFLECSWGSH